MTFNVQVRVSFNPVRGVPGESATLQVTALSNSLCGINVIDQSVLIKEPDQHLNAEKAG